MLWAIDEAQIDPLLGGALADFGNVTLGLLHLPEIDPDRVRVHRDSSLAGNQVLVAELTDTVDIWVPRELVTAEVAHQLELHSTAVLRTIKHMLPVLPIIGQNGSPPAA